MPTRKAEASWKGNLKEGKGTMKTGSGTCEGGFSFASRFEDGKGTNPEELIGAAHAGCFSMAFAHLLAEKGHTPEEIRTSARVTIEKSGDGFAIKTVRLSTQGRVPGIEKDTFLEIAEEAKNSCPVSKALAGVDIELEAELAEGG